MVSAKAESPAAASMMSVPPVVTKFLRDSCDRASREKEPVPVRWAILKPDRVAGATDWEVRLTWLVRQRILDRRVQPPGSGSGLGPSIRRATRMGRAGR